MLPGLLRGPAAQLGLELRHARSLGLRLLQLPGQGGGALLCAGRRLLRLLRRGPGRRQLALQLGRAGRQLATLPRRRRQLLLQLTSLQEQHRCERVLMQSLGWTLRAQGPAAADHEHQRRRRAKRRESRETLLHPYALHPLPAPAPTWAA